MAEPAVTPRGDLISMILSFGLLRADHQAVPSMTIRISRLNDGRVKSVPAEISKVGGLVYVPVLGFCQHAAAAGECKRPVHGEERRITTVSLPLRYFLAGELAVDYQLPWMR